MAQYVFPKVEPADIQYSKRNMALYKPFTASVGPLYPILSLDVLPSDFFRINTIATVQSLPMIAPVRGRWKVNFDYFFEPWSNLYGFMDNATRLDTNTILNMSRWTMKVGGTFEAGSGSTIGSVSPDELRYKCRVGSGSLLDFLGAPVGYQGNISLVNTDAQGTTYKYMSKPTLHPAESFLTYLDIVRNYYVNNQQNEIPYIRACIGASLQDNNSSTTYQYESLDNLDNIFSNLRSLTNRNGGFEITNPTTNFGAGLVRRLIFASQGQPNPLSANDPGNVDLSVGDLADYDAVVAARQCGLFLRTYRMDLLRGVMNSSVSAAVAKVTVSNGQFTMPSVYLANKDQQLMNRLSISGGRFPDWITTRWNIDSGIQIDRPLWLGSHSMWLNTIDVVATAAGESGADSNNPSSELGQQAGYQVGKMSVGRGKGRQRPITLKAKQYGTLMCIFSIVPDVVYSQGFELSMLKTTFASIYDPAYKQLGFQDVLKAEMNAFPSVQTNATLDAPPTQWIVTDSKPTEKVAMRIAWSEYMNSLNRAHGDFAYGQPLDYWVNNRIYASSESTPVAGNGSQNPIMKRLYQFDSTTYVLPTLWNSQFAQKDISAMNYLVDVYFAIDANRPIGKRIMPHM